MFVEQVLSQNDASLVPGSWPPASSRHCASTSCRPSSNPALSGVNLGPLPSSSPSLSEHPFIKGPHCTFCSPSLPRIMNTKKGKRERTPREKELLCFPAGAQECRWRQSGAVFGLRRVAQGQSWQRRRRQQRLCGFGGGRGEPGPAPTQCRRVREGGRDVGGGGGCHSSQA